MMTEVEERSSTATEVAWIPRAKASISMKGRFSMYSQETRGHGPPLVRSFLEGRGPGDPGEDLEPGAGETAVDADRERRTWRFVLGGWGHDVPGPWDGPRDGPDRQDPAPFALVGRSPDSDLCVRDAAVSDRHVYAHLDPRGVYVVDLLTRTGTRINGLSQSADWLRPDQSFEVAGRRVTLLRMRINGEVREPDPSDADLLAETTQADLVGVTLEPSQPSDPPWVLGSELVFLGWSSSCGIQIQDKRVARRTAPSSAAGRARTSLT